MFYELWGHEAADPQKRKPFRFTEDPTPEDIEAKLGDSHVRSLSRDGKGHEPCKIAHAVPVYNYDLERYNFFMDTEKTITQDFDGISQLEDYADSMTEVDFFIKKGEGTDTKYSVQAAPRKQGMTLTIAEEWESVNEVGFDLNELIKGGDPFKPE